MSLKSYSAAEIQAELQRREAAFRDGLCDFCGQAPDAPVCTEPERHRFPLKTGLCFVCNVGKVPPRSGKVCSVACALQVPLEIEEGRIDPADRPQPGEVWSRFGQELHITTVDPYGRSFDYIRVEERGETKFGQIGSLDVTQKDAVRVRKRV